MLVAVFMASAKPPRRSGPPTQTAAAVDVDRPVRVDSIYDLFARRGDVPVVIIPFMADAKCSFDRGLPTFFFIIHEFGLGYGPANL